MSPGQLYSRSRKDAVNNLRGAEDGNSGRGRAEVAVAAVEGGGGRGRSGGVVGKGSGGGRRGVVVWGTRTGRPNGGKGREDT